MPFVTDYSGIPYDTKDPGDTNDYVLDFTSWLAEKADTIRTVSFVANGATVVSSGYAGALVSVWISGGTLGQVATVTCTVNTTGGRTQVRTFNLRIQSR